MRSAHTTAQHEGSSIRVEPTESDFATPASDTPWPFPKRPLTYTASGSAAFECIVREADLIGGRVILPAFLCRGAFPSIFERYELHPEFIDIDPATFHLDFERVSGVIADADAVLLDHAFGQVAPLDRWERLTRRADVILIEDCARAMGAMHDGRFVGGAGAYGLYSFAKVTPLFRGGAVSHGTSHMARAQASITPDTIVRTLHDLLPDSLQAGSTMAARYHAFRRQLSSSAGGSNTQAGRPAGLDSLTTWRFKRYLRHRFIGDQLRMERVATKLRQVLSNAGFWVSDPDVPYVLQALAPDDRDLIVERFRDRGYPVHIVWRTPWGLDHGEFPVTRYVANQVITFRLRAWTEDDVHRLHRDIEVISQE